MPPAFSSHLPTQQAGMQVVPCACIVRWLASMFSNAVAGSCVCRCGVAGEDGAVMPLEKVDVPAEMSCGFLGEPDAGGFYSKSNRVERATSASGAAPPTDSKGRIGG
eukprot:6210248-Pleurochrysis_carterae.AAC.3